MEEHTEVLPKETTKAIIQYFKLILQSAVIIVIIVTVVTVVTVILAIIATAIEKDRPVSN